MHILRVFEAARAAIGHIEALEGEVTTALAWRLPVAFDLPTFAFRASNGNVAIPL